MWRETSEHVVLIGSPADTPLHCPTSSTVSIQSPVSSAGGGGSTTKHYEVKPGHV